MFPPRSRRALAALAAAAAVGPSAGVPGGPSALAAPDSTTIALVVDGPWDRNAPILEVFRREILALLGDEFGARIPDDRVITADWTVDGVRAALESAYADPGVDAVVALGLLASNEVSRMGPRPKPTVGPFVIDPVVQGVPLVDGRSGVANLVYITSLGALRRDFRAFREIVPFDRLAFLVTATVVDAIPGLRGRVERAAADVGLSVTLVPIGDSADDALAGIGPDAEAVYVAPLLRLEDAEFDRLVEGLVERKLPSFSLLGRSEVERGILAGLTPESEFPRMARRTALNLQRMLSGENGADLPVHFSDAERLTLNLSTARALGVRPTWAVITEADLVGVERAGVERRLTLDDAVREAVVVNTDLAAAGRDVAEGAAAVDRARAPLLPSLEASARGVWIDEDQAASSFGQAAERTLSAVFSLSQAIFSDAAWAALSVERRRQLARELERDAVTLDVAREASVAYLDVLRAKTLERTLRDDLERSLANLELARVREAVGASGPGEVFRWQGQIATGRRDVIEANARRNLAEIELNRVLHRPPEESFGTEDPGLSDPTPLEARVRAFLADPWSFRVLREFLEAEGIRRSPEIGAIDAAIDAQARLLTAAERSLWLPTVGLSAELVRILERDGAGTGAASLGPVEIPPPEDTRWSVGLEASLPLLEGGARLAERRRAREAIAALVHRREALRDRIRQRVRSAAHLAGASFAGIELSRDAADAAARNLDLVRDGYSEGILDALDLLDAQNAALVADERAANAVFDFLVDLAELQRAVGGFFCLATPEENEDFVRRLEAAREEEEAR